MPQNKWSWVVFYLSVGGYIPLMIGGSYHPSEINIASYGIWSILTAMMLYASIAQGFAGWRMPFAWTIGNVSMLALCHFMGGGTFNLGWAESIMFFGVTYVIGLWATVGAMTGMWNPRILFLGSVLVDSLSFYPQWKQYLLPHEPPTNWLLLGWALMLAGAVINFALVEKLFQKLWMSKLCYWFTYSKPKKVAHIIEESALSLENSILMMITIFLMTR